ncbi:MAG: 30S ribosomal protein S12 methylthiotransferase RimO [Eubacterium sp.]|nr:30S ribosomal protein S12 methylthiotransferase RimO [Eubacterium sp.]
MKVFLVSLGCDKNLVDSEHIVGLMHEAGYEFTDNESEADVIIINSCCFIHDAKEESINTIFEMAQYKTEGACKALVLCGCLAERYYEEIPEEIPEIDICIGTSAFEDIVKAIDEFFDEKSHITCMKDVGFLAGTKSPRNITPYNSYSYLKIAEGCEKHCTYCIIPYVRGDFRSVPMEDLVREAKLIAEQGIKEIILVAQETTMYGTDLYGEKSLHKLIREISNISGIEWIRILYCYPEDVYDELIEEMATNEKVCHYIDIPIQHASNDILKAMGRQTTGDEIREKISQLRNKIPDIVIRTTLITGFPGETEEDHQILKDFVSEMKFERLGVFTYSAEEGTPAARMSNQIDEVIKETRRDELMTLQQNIVFERAEDYIGKEFTSIIEGKIPQENAYIARTYMDAPGVDSNIFVVTDRELMTGDFVNVKVTGTNEYDLIGKPVD